VLQLIVWLMAFYLIIKGIEVLQIGLASSRERRSLLIVIGVLTLIACVIVAIGTFVTLSPPSDRTTVSDIDVTPRGPGQSVSKELQADRAAEVDAHNKGWEWAKQHKVTKVQMCAELGDAQVRVGCERYADASGK